RVHGTNTQNQEIINPVSLERYVITTGDGSKTIHLKEWNENYHSTHGAIQETKHVFIRHGLLFFIENLKDQTPISILEIGFVTGLNAFITLIEAENQHVAIDYLGVEAFPVKSSELKELNYSEQLSADLNTFERLHRTSWEEKHAITDNFFLTKQKKLFFEIEDWEQFDIIYFDAFGARVQPELWTETIFKKMHDALKPQGILVTYSAKGSVRRAMQSVGFLVEKLPGPPGKREMLRAKKDAEHSASV